MEVTENDPFEPDPEPKESVVGLTVNEAAAADWLTVTVLVIPPPETVTVALRLLVEVFAPAVTVTEPLLLPDEGDTVNHDWLLETLQLTLEVTENDPFEPDPEPKESVVGLTVNEVGTR